MSGTGDRNAKRETSVERATPLERDTSPEWETSPERETSLERDPSPERESSLERDDVALAEAVRALPRERQPGDLLEERTVRALRAAGVLAGGRRIPRGWYAAAAAASIALFACGMAVGQWLGARQTASLLAVHQQATLDEMSALVEQTGSAYVSALARLAEANGMVGSPASVDARDQALQFLHMAANEVVRLAPNDPVAAGILQGFEHAALQQTPPQPGERRRQIVWF